MGFTEMNDIQRSILQSAYLDPWRDLESYLRAVERNKDMRKRLEKLLEQEKIKRGWK